MKSNDMLTVESRLDSFGAILSLLCAIHCTLLPGLVAILPFIALESLISESVHKVIIIGSVALAFGSCAWGYRRHRKFSPVFIFCFGVGLILTGLIINSPFNEVTIAIGALILALGHLVNHLFCRWCLKCQKQQ